MKLVLIDDDCLVVNALKTILEAQPDFEVTAVGEDGKDALTLYRKHRPDVLLMDIRMKEISGLDASEEILQEFPDARILLLTTFTDDEYIVKALRCGARGYLLKQDYQNIAPAIRAVCSVKMCSEMRSSHGCRTFFRKSLLLIMPLTTSANGNWTSSV